MSLIPCPNKIGCESDYPVTNYSSEDADPRSFIGFSTGTAPTSSFTRGGGGGPRDGGPDRDDTGDGQDGTAQTGTGGNPPPLGSDYDNPIVTTFAESTESQAKAWDDAGNDNVSAMTVPSNTGEPGGGIVLNPSRLRPAVYGNDPQQWTQLCPDGTPFTFTVPANVFKALSKAKANAAALSFACQQAQLNQICLGSINGNICAGDNFNEVITASTANIPVTFVIVAGDLPDWVTAFVGTDNVQLLGDPQVSDIADTSFTIAATDIFGTTVTKEYTISVTGCNCTISTTDLTQFDQGQPYTFQLVSDAIEPAIWELVGGELPTGLSLAQGGVISGTPNIGPPANGDQTFTVKVTGDDGGTCSKTLTIEVLDYHSLPPGKAWRIKDYSDSMFPVPPGPFGCNCTDSGSPTADWDGKFNAGSGGIFASSLVNAFGEVDIISNTERGVKPSINLGHVEWENHAWVITITCVGGSEWVWVGIKSGSNQGSKLDSPAGIYTLFTGAIGEPGVCSSVGSVEVEEYTV